MLSSISDMICCDKKPKYNTDNPSQNVLFDFIFIISRIGINL